MNYILSKHARDERGQQRALPSDLEDEFTSDETKLPAQSEDMSCVDGVNDIRDGVWRRVYEDCVTFLPDHLFYDRGVERWDYVVMKFTRVCGFHLCEIRGNDSRNKVKIHSTHKTLAEAMSICKVLLANGGVHYV